MDIHSQIAQILSSTSGILEESRSEHSRFEMIASELNSHFANVDEELAAMHSEIADVIREAQNEEVSDHPDSDETPTPTSG